MKVIILAAGYATRLHPLTLTQPKALLLVAGSQDRVAPSSMIKANFDLYRESKADTDYKEFPDQTHFSLLQETKVADYVLGWAICRSNGSKLTAVANQTDSWSVKLST